MLLNISLLRPPYLELDSLESSNYKNPGRNHHGGQDKLWVSGLRKSRDQTVHQQ